MGIMTLPGTRVDTPIDTPKSFTVTPGFDEVTLGSDAAERSTWSNTFGAAFRQGNTVAGALAEDGREDPSYREPGFNPWEKIKGTDLEPHWDRFVDVFNDRQFEKVATKILREREDRKLLHDAPWYQSLPAELIAGTLDLPTLLPGGAFVRSAKGGFSMARSGAVVGAAAGLSSATQELILQSQQETRPGAQSALNIGASVFLGGLLGAAGARVLSKAEWTAATRAIEADLERHAALDVPGSSPASAGAAVREPLAIELNTIAGRMAGTVASASARLNPALRILQSPSPAVREIGTQLFENSVYLKKNFEGVASEPAVETLMKEWNGGLAKAITATEEAFRKWRQAGHPLSREDFRDVVGKVLRRGDESSSPEITAAAKAWRNEVFDPLKDAAIKAGLLPKDVKVETATSYFTRMWNRQTLNAREGEFKQIVVDWIMKQAPRWAEDFDKETIRGATKLRGAAEREYRMERRLERESRFEGDGREMANGIADEVFKTLTGRGNQQARPEFITIQARGPLKERTFNIPDVLVEQFLEHDVDLVGRRYTRVMGADVELATKFGSADMKEQIAQIHEDYAKLRAGVTDEKKLMRLGVAEKNDIRDIEALRDMLRGTNYEKPIEENYARLARGVNHVNYMRSMGEVVLASLTDVIRPAMVHGLGALMGSTAQLATNIKAVKMSVAEAQLAGNVAERVLGHRLATISEIIDPYSSRGPVEAFLENMTNVASKWNGIRLWTDGMKAIASVMTQNRILANAERFATIRPRERAYMAYLGLDQSTAERVAAQFAAHGQTLDGVRVANTESWTDAVAVRAYRAAINKDVDSIIVQKSVADVPLFASTPTGRMLLQFKSFALASHQKVLLRGLQEDQARFVGGLAAMTAMGMLITYLKAISGNRAERFENINDKMGWWIGEGLDRSGVFSVPVELANAAEKVTGWNAIKSPLKLLDQASAESQRLQNRNELGALLGPSAGFVQDAIEATGIPKKVLGAGENLNNRQRRAIKNLLPFNSYAGIRQMLEYLALPQER
jgi:hypothetical protein